MRSLLLLAPLVAVLGAPTFRSQTQLSPLCPVDGGATDAVGDRFAFRNSLVDNEKMLPPAVFGPFKRAPATSKRGVTVSGDSNDHLRFDCVPGSTPITYLSWGDGGKDQAQKFVAKTSAPLKPADFIQLAPANAACPDKAQGESCYCIRIGALNNPEKQKARDAALLGDCLLVSIPTDATGSSSDIADMKSFVQACASAKAAPVPLLQRNFPYHPLTHALDLCVLAYQSHAEALLYPWDPFYEAKYGANCPDRDAVMARVRMWAKENGGKEDVANPLNRLRGPSVVSGLPDNGLLDPIMYQYSKLNPWAPNSAFHDGSRWIIYTPSAAITSKIASLSVACTQADPKRPLANPPAVDSAVFPGRAAPANLAPRASDAMCVFEGETGATPANPVGVRSPMGFVLARATGEAGNAYDLHVAFRGSRSGSAARAVWQAQDLIGVAKGNPDWVTDLSGALLSGKDAQLIASAFSVQVGFALAIKSALPHVFKCIGDVQASRFKMEGKPTMPGNIYVTGHSLGGALAQLFVSSVTLGTAVATFSPSESVTKFAWKNIKLVTMSAPVAGDEAWAKELSKVLQSPSLSDDYAIGPANSRITQRLYDTTRPAAFRVLVSSDPITTTKLGGYHVGQTVFVDHSSTAGVARDVVCRSGLADGHEPVVVRAYLMAALADLDPAPPASAMTYRATEALCPACAAGNVHGVLASAYGRLSDQGYVTPWTPGYLLTQVGMCGAT